MIVSDDQMFTIVNLIICNFDIIKYDYSQLHIAFLYVNIDVLNLEIDISCLKQILGKPVFQVIFYMASMCFCKQNNIL